VEEIQRLMPFTSLIARFFGENAMGVQGPKLRNGVQIPKKNFGSRQIPLLGTTCGNGAESAFVQTALQSGILPQIPQIHHSLQWSLLPSQMSMSRFGLSASLQFG
jgi:hypothetical protein